MADELSTDDRTGLETANAGALTMTQAELDRIIAERLSRQRTQFETAAARDRDTSEQARLEAQQEYRLLAEQRAARIAELEPHAARAEAASAAVGQLVARERVGLPAPILLLLDRMDVVEQLGWLAEHRAALVASTTTPAIAPTAPANTNATARGTAPSKPDARTIVDELRRSGGYTGF